MKRFYALLTLLGIALCGVAQVPALITVGAYGQTALLFYEQHNHRKKLALFFCRFLH